MRALVLGGSSFVGYHAVAELLARGHEVTVLNRGQTDPDAHPDAEQLRADRNGDLSVLAGRSFDATLDVSAYQPRQIGSLLAALGDGVGLYTLVSTISVFPLDIPAGYLEDSARLAPLEDAEVSGDTYGALKVGCENLARAAAPAGVLVVRPGYVLGPRDKTMRYPTWVQRVAAGEPFDGPPAEHPFQGIDARDLAAFTIGRMEAGDTSTYDVTAPWPVITWQEALEQTASGVGVALPEVRWGVESEDDMPLVAPPEIWGLMQADLTRAIGAGLRWRPLAETAADTWAWLETLPSAVK